MTQPHRLADQKDDIQGIVLWGYGRYKHAYYLPLRVTDPAAARAWLKPEVVQPAGDRREDAKVRFAAFTAEGLVALWGGDESIRRLVRTHFPEAFRRGMSSRGRARALGDVGESSPEGWSWGDVSGSDGDLVADRAADPGLSPVGVHVLLGVFRTEPQQAEWATFLDGSGLALVREHPHESYEMKDDRGWFREHFGFVDGLAQPILKGGLRKAPRTPDPGAMVAPGEFVLGFEDQEGPGLQRSEALGARLLWNGSYMVFRQLEQRVADFWRFVRAEADHIEVPAGVASNGSGPPVSLIERRIWLGAKMVGRWPNGVPFALADRWDEAQRFVKGSPRELDDFSYARDDAAGHGCPIGSHVRRANPRDADLSTDRAEARMLINRRRLLRRGRTYGCPVQHEGAPRFEEVMGLTDADFEELLVAHADNDARGLLFVCFNADIERQFEFVQQSWLNNPHFAGLVNDPDPVVGSANEQLDDPRPHSFTIPGTPKRTRVNGFGRFVTARAGGYFFVPGIEAFQLLLSDKLKEMARAEFAEEESPEADGMDAP